MLSSSLGEVADDGGIGVEQVCNSSDLRGIESLALDYLPSRVMPGLRGTPAGMRTISDPFKHSFNPDGVGSYPVTCSEVN